MNKDKYPLSLRLLEIIFVVIGLPIRIVWRVTNWIHEHIPAP